MSAKSIIGLMCGVLCYFQSITLLIASQSSTFPPQGAVSNTSLGKPPEGSVILVESLKYSVDMKHVTYVSRNEKNQFFVHNDSAVSRPYFTVFQETPFFTKDQNRHAYIASSAKNKVFAVVDGTAGPIFDELDHLTFSPDESRFAYRAVKGDKQCVVMDHTPQALYDGIPIKKNFGFSPDSQHFAYVAYDKEKKECVFILDEKEYQHYPFIEDIVFSPDSKQFAFAARVGKKDKTEFWRVVHNGRESDIYGKIFSIVFSPDSKQFAFVAMKGSQMALVINNHEIVYPRIGIPVFSPDSTRLAYAFFQNNNWRIHIDGNQGPKLDNVLTFYYSTPENTGELQSPS